MINSRASALPPEVRLEYPFSGHTFDQPATVVGGDPVKMHYIDEGSGPVVIMLHGNPTWSFYYRNVVHSLSAQGYRCVVPDHIGCGLSDKPQDYPYTLARRIEDVERLVDHLGITSFSLILHDWGGAIGCGLAGRRPAALEKLVLLNTAAFRSLRIPWRIAAIKLPFLGPLIIRGLNGFAGPAAVMSVCRPLASRVRKGLLWPYRSWASRVAVWNFVKDIPLRAAHPSYQTLDAVEASLSELKDKPVQLIWGARDFCFNLHFYRRWRRYFPAAKLHVHEDSGHYILEDGGEDVLREIKLFMDS
jgi:cis-3-alkyl-4-acyloxetan-2-one decarboxylase